MSTESTTTAADPKAAFELGVAHAADMFGFVRHIVECRNGPGLSLHADARIINFELGYTEGQINVGEAFIRALIDNPEWIKGFGAVLTGLLGLIEQGRTLHNLADEAKVTYEEWVYKRPADGGATIAAPDSPPSAPAAEAKVVA